MDFEGMNILHVVGARPNFMKAAPVMAAIGRCEGMRQTLVHTGQHFDAMMSTVFFDELGLPKPDHFLGINGGSHAQMTARIMLGIEPILEAERPDWLLVYGDVNSTVAAALVAAKLGIRIAHVEAGLRSGDRGMPEELNRMVTDQLADLLLTPSVDADANLKREGVAEEKIRMVGNVMIDSLVTQLPKARKPEGIALPERYALVTLHRPSNVDTGESLVALMACLEALAKETVLVFPIHPRTRQRLEQIGWDNQGKNNLLLVEPLGYLEFLWLQQHAKYVLTDSGGIQEETTFLRVPCLTLRENTERPVTITHGSNRLVRAVVPELKAAVAAALADRPTLAAKPLPPLWDGKAAERIAKVLSRSHRDLGAF